MYHFLSLLTGVLISLMIVVNGGLTERYGVYSATVIIHVVGLTLITACLLLKREWPFLKRHRWFLYTGGVIGVMTTAFNNLAFGRISVSAIMALGLFGQSISGLLFDQYGWLGLPKHAFRKQKIMGLLLIFGGIFAMINNFEMIAVSVSFFSGITIVVSRVINARLAELTSVRIGTFYNYVTGIAVAIPVFFLLGGNEFLRPSFTTPANPYIYLGGALGVCVVLLSNMTVTKISAFYLSLLLFVGQVFSGILLDALIDRSFSPRNLIGGVLVALGLCLNLLLDSRRAGADKHIESV